MFLYLLLSIFLFWIIILSYYTFSIRKHYFRLTQRTKKHKIDEILDQLISDDDKNCQGLKELSKEVEKMKSEAVFFYKKMGLVRFDPFGRTEGEKSFVLSLLDGNDNGVVLNFIYIHDGIRVYAKKVKEGRGEELELSQEEKQAVEKAN